MPRFNTDAYANAPDTLGVCNIENPEYKVDGSAYNRVYFGKTPTLSEDKHSVKLLSGGTSTNGGVYILHDEPIYWRVLNTTANGKKSSAAESNEPALFMLTEYCITNNMSWDNRDISSCGQRWAREGNITDSAIKRFLQGADGGMYTGTPYASSAYEDCFEEAERNVIMTTYNEETTNYDINNLTQNDLKWYLHDNNIRYAYGCGLNGDKLFLLSAMEVIKREYGFNPTRNTPTGSNPYYAPETNRRTRQYNANRNSTWWLRSAYSYYRYGIACVSSSGFSIENGSILDTDCAVRFALNIPLSSILFAQDANSSSSTPSPTFTIIPSNLTRTKFIDNTNDTYAPVQIYIIEGDQDILCNDPTPPGAKLTIVDNSRNNFAVDEELLFCDIGDSITIHYTGATTGSNEYISAIIKNVYGNHYHARLCSVDESNGEITMSIPSELPYGEYTLIVYNEKENGAYATNYARYDVKTLMISDITKPVVNKHL